MGHYYAEMFPNGRKSDLELRRIRKEREKDIENLTEDTVKDNPTSIDDIVIGDRLKFYPKLFEQKIPHEKHYGNYTLADYVHGYKIKSKNMEGSFKHTKTTGEIEFQVYDINENKDAVRLNPKPDASRCIPIDLFQKWVNIRYFSKKE